MNFKITTLCENTIAQAGKNLIGEHGLAFYIETEENKILFDTGQNLAISNNAAVLGIDLSQIDTVVLSHGHYDHTGGLESVLRCNPNFTLVAHPDVFAEKLKRADNSYRFIGVPHSIDVHKQNSIKVKLETTSVQIAPGIMSTGEIPLENDFEGIDRGFYIQNSKKITPDTLADDQAIVLDTKKGSVVLLGCSHRGVINTLNHVAKLTGRETIHAVFGGLHLGNASDLKLKKIVDHLVGFDLQKIGVGHCTGPRAFVALSNEFPNRVFLNTVGNTAIF